MGNDRGNKRASDSKDEGGKIIKRLKNELIKTDYNEQLIGRIVRAIGEPNDFNSLNEGLRGTARVGSQAPPLITSPQLNSSINGNPRVSMGSNRKNKKSLDSKDEGEKPMKKSKGDDSGDIDEKVENATNGSHTSSLSISRQHTSSGNDDENPPPHTPSNSIQEKTRSEKSPLSNNHSKSHVGSAGQSDENAQADSSKLNTQSRKRLKFEAGSGVNEELDNNNDGENALKISTESVKMRKGHGSK